MHDWSNPTEPISTQPPASGGPEASTPGLASGTAVQIAVFTARAHVPAVHATAGQFFSQGSQAGSRQYAPSGAHALPSASFVSMS
jgi:hypothetical protein